MRRIILFSALVLAAGCGGQSTTDPCTIRVNVIDAANAYPGNVVSVDADVTVRAGTCAEAEKQLSWLSKSTDVAEVVSSNSEGAELRAKKAGTTTVVAWLTRTPSVRDSILFTVLAVVDTTAQ